LLHILLNGESRPAIFPQPAATFKGFKIPIAESKDGKDKEKNEHNERMRKLVWEGAKTLHLEALKDMEQYMGVAEGTTSEQLEENLARQQLECDKTMLTLLQLACQGGRIEQAMDYVHKLRTDQALESAIMIANKFGRTNVAKAIATIIDARNEQIRQNEEAEDLAWQQSNSSISEETQDYEEDNQVPIEMENRNSNLVFKKNNGNNKKFDDEEEVRVRVRVRAAK
jgi:hypothetical protein